MATYRTKFTEPNYRHEPQTEAYCAICQRDIGPGQKHRWVHLVDGGPFALHPADEAAFSADVNAAGGDMGCFPIGYSCARKLGLEWSFESEALDANLAKLIPA
jgi:hypothetical protein